MNTETSNNTLQASFSSLAISIASSAMVELGMTPNPETNVETVNLPMAQFNIDLLMVLKTKTHGNLSKEEENLLCKIINDVQVGYVNAQKSQ